MPKPRPSNGQSLVIISCISAYNPFPHTDCHCRASNERHASHRRCNAVPEESESLTAEAVACRASPEVAPYPFTTLMPNLGVMAAGQPASAAGAEPELEPWEVAAEEERAPVLADLPGLIEGAHTGRGLGRNFLRHLRRTRGILHVVDASAGDRLSQHQARSFGQSHANTSQQAFKKRSKYTGELFLVQSTID